MYYLEIFHRKYYLQNLKDNAKADLHSTRSLDQLLIFSPQLYLIELLGFLTSLWLLELWHLINPRLLTGFGMLVFFTNLRFMEFQVRYLALFLLSNTRLRVVLEGKSSQEYPVNVGVSQGSILGPTLFLLYISDLPDHVICDIAIYADDTTLYSKCDQASDLWQQLELASELESDLRDTVDWGRKWLGLTFSSKLDWGSYIISIAKTVSKKIGALIRSIKFLSPEVALYLYKSTIHPCMEYCCHVWAVARSCYLELLDKLQKRICRIVGPSLTASLEPLAHC